MKIQIKNRYNSSVIYECEADTLREAVEKAVKEGISLGGANLEGADLGGANLEGANLEGADLVRADLGGADLVRADLGGADLGGANLEEANLEEANLYGADLYGADLGGASLEGASLEGADLVRAYLGGADLRRANLRRASLKGANLANLKEPLSEKQLSTFKIVPETGGFYGFKKMQNNIVLKIFVSKNAKRVNSFNSRKCRASKVKVIEAYNLDGSKANGELFINPTHQEKLAYKIGKWVEVKDFCDDMSKECAPGIHFFLTFEEAKNW